MKAERPLSRYLDAPTDEARVVGMWARIRERRDRRGRARWPIAAAGAVAIAAAVGLVVWAAPWSDAAAPLTTARGHLPSVIEADEAPRSWQLADGSTVELGAGGRLEAIENDDGRFVTLLSRGVARFSVTPGGPRRWIVESGLATVEVIGTVFTVARSDEGVRVSVERGVVLVRGERVPDRVARLTRGQTLFVPRRAGAPLHADDGRAESLAARGATSADDAVASAGAVDVASEHAEGTDEAGSRGAGSGASASDAPAEAPRGSEADDPESRPARPRGARPSARRAPSDEAPDGATIDAWLDHADAARRRGDLRTAVRLLRRVAARGDDSRAALAAFTLGRLEMDELHRPTAARTAFRRALALGLPERLAQQARLRLTEIGDGAPPAPEPAEDATP